MLARELIRCLIAKLRVQKPAPEPKPSPEPTASIPARIYRSDGRICNIAVYPQTQIVGIPVCQELRLEAILNGERPDFGIEYYQAIGAVDGVRIFARVEQQTEKGCSNGSCYVRPM